MIVRGDALNLPLPDESVDLVITSPPYFALRSYRDAGEHYGGQIGSEPTPKQFLEALWAATREMVRVLKPTGSIFINLGDKYAGSGGANQSGYYPQTKYGKANARGVAYKKGTRAQYPKQDEMVRAKSLMGLPWRYAIGCIDQLNLILRAEIVWNKPNGLPESVTDRVRRSHEQWFHFTKEGRYFSGVDEIREPHIVGFNGSIFQGRGTRPDGHSPGTTPEALHPLGKLPGSVWTIPSEPLIVPDWAKEKYNLPDHFAAFPQELPRRIILGWSPSGVCVECGEGRRPVVAKDLQVDQRGIVGSRESRYKGEEAARAHQHNRMGQEEVYGTTEATVTGYACACNLPTEGVSAVSGKVITLGLPPTRAAVVLDPFVGTGTVPMVAKSLGRQGIGVDLSGDYCRLAKWRCEESGHGKKTEQRTWKERQGTLA